MKKAIIIIATVILATLMTLPAAACETEYHNDELVNQYVQNIEAGQFYHTDNMYFVTVVNGQEIAQTFDGILDCNGQCICTDVSTLGIPTIKTELINYYMEQIETRNYIASFGKTSYLTFNDNFDVFYVTEDGRLMYNGEVLALFNSDINFKKKRLHIQRTVTSDLNNKSIIGTKTKTYAGNRVIPLNELTYNILQKYKNNKPLLFSYNEEPIRTSTVSSHLRRACAKAGVRVKKYRKKKGDKSFILETSNASSHMLRHTYATRCIEAGMPPVVLQRLLGHKDIATTLNTYTDIFHEVKEDEIAKLQEYLDKVI